MADIIDVITAETVDSLMIQMEQLAEQLVESNDAKIKNIIDTANKFIAQYNKYERATRSYANAAKKYAEALRVFEKNKKSNTMSSKSADAQLTRIANLKAKANTLRGKLMSAEKAEQSAEQLLYNTYEAMLTFRKSVLDFLGRQINMVFVVKNSKGERVLYDISELDLRDMTYMDRQSLSRGGAFTLRFASGKIKKNAKKLNLNNRQLEVKKMLDAFYENLNYRLKAAKAVGTGVLLWKLNGIWNKVKFAQLGDLEETYANILINYGLNDKVIEQSYPPFLTETNPEIQIDTFVRGWLSQVDATAGFLVEDILDIEKSLEEDAPLTFWGVKTTGASIMQIREILEFARDIKKRNINPRKYAKLFSSPSREQNARIKISSVVESELDKAVREEIEGTIKKVFDKR